MECFPNKRWIRFSSESAINLISVEASFFQRGNFFPKSNNDRKLMLRREVTYSSVEKSLFSTRFSESQIISTSGRLDNVSIFFPFGITTVHHRLKLRVDVDSTDIIVTQYRNLTSPAQHQRFETDFCLQKNRKTLRHPYSTLGTKLQISFFTRFQIRKRFDSSFTEVFAKKLDKEVTF